MSAHDEYELVAHGSVEFTVVDLAAVRARRVTPKALACTHGAYNAPSPA